jgi:TM2 domain-containing membrane protein YozV
MENTQLGNLKGKNWMAAMMLCWLFGALGAHRFYTGKTNTAIAMLVLTLTGCFAPIAAIWQLVDGIMIALGKFTHEDGSELYERINWVGYVYIAFMILAILAIIGYIALFGFAIMAALGNSGIQ